MSRVSPAAWLWPLGLSLCVNLSAQAETPLRIVPVLYQNIAIEQWLDGTVEAVQQATVSAQTSGQITEIFFDINDYVKKGQVLLRLKDTEQRATMAGSEAQLREAQARYQEAREEHTRIKKLQAQSLMSKAALDGAQANLDATQARLNAMQASVKQTQEQLKYAEVKAPYSGVVVERLVQLGETASPGKPLMTGLSLDALRVVAQVPQNLVARVRKYEQARVLLDNGSGEVQNLTLKGVTLVPYADKSHTFKMRINLPENLKDLYPGMFVKIAFVISEDKRLVVPSAAIAHRGEVRAAYVVREAEQAANNQYSMRQVRVGQRFDNGMLEILAGLAPGELVALDPVRASVLLKEQQTLPAAAAVAH